MDIEKNINIFIEDQFSANYRTNGALLVEFIECYYKWAQETDNFVNAARSLPEQYDADYIAEEFLDILHNEFLQILPKDLKTNKRTLIKNILGFYQSRGTEDAYRMLFRILYNQEINIYYPGKDVLRFSDGKWYVGRRINITTTYTGDFTDIPEIIGVTSGAIARVENVITTVESSVTTTSLYLTNIRGTFVQNENIKIRYTDTVIGLIVSNGLIVDAGYWLNSDGHLSADKYIQDNFYYQDFSYEIQSTIPIIDYRDISESVVHPAGTKLFGKVLNTIDIPLQGSLIIDLDLSKIYEYSFNISSNTNVTFENIHEVSFSIDKSAQELPGAGTISINNGQILHFAGVTAAEFGQTPISYIGTTRLLFGTGTQFLSEVGQSTGITPSALPAVLKIMDTDNSVEDQYTADTSYADRFQTIVENYPFPSFTGETYTIIKSIPDQIDSFNYTSIDGTGDITWAGSGNITGNSTLFTTEIDVEDIIYISANTQLLVTGITSNVAISILYGGETYSFTNTAYKVIKNN